MIAASSACQGTVLKKRLVEIQAAYSHIRKFARVVKGVDLRSTAGNCAWVRTPQLACKVFWDYIRALSSRVPRGSFQSRGQCLSFEECESKAYLKLLRKSARHDESEFQAKLPCHILGQLQAAGEAEQLSLCKRRREVRGTFVQNPAGESTQVSSVGACVVMVRGVWLRQRR